MNSEEELMTAQELADALSLSVDTVWRYTREKKIPYVEIGSRQYRYNKQKVLRVLAGTVSSSLVKDDLTSYQPHKKLTYVDYVSIPEEPGFRHELIDGMLTRDPSPSLHHQRVSRRLYRILENYFNETDPLGEVFYAPLDLNLAAQTVVQPDLMYFPGNRPVLNDPVDTTPGLIVEISSPSTSRKDRVLKLNHYQASGVAHYWILDPEDCFVEAYELRDKHYVSMVRAGEGLFSHPGFPGLSFNIVELFKKPA